MAMDPYPFTLNGQYIKEGEDFPCYEFPEPFVHDGKCEPGFEMFLDCDFVDEGEELFTTEKPASPSSDDLNINLIFGLEKNESKPNWNDDSELIQAVISNKDFDPPS